MKNVRLNVEVPAQPGGAEASSSPFVRVGVIALVGFGVGVAWPRVMGIQVGPAPIPSLTAGEPESDPRALATAGTATPLASASAAPAASNSAPTKANGPVAITIAKGVVLSCRNSEGETLKGRECGGAPKGLDAFVAPHLGKLAQCPAASEAQGKLSAVLTFDFRASRLTSEVGKSSTVSTTEPLGKCLKEALSGVELPTVSHEHSRYAVAYSVNFEPGQKSAAADSSAKPAPADSADEATDPAAPSASGSSGPMPSEGSSAVIEWDTARVRNAPRNGEIIARWSKGTKVTVVTHQGGWLKVKRDGSSEEGWIYKSALGR